MQDQARGPKPPGKMDHQSVLTVPVKAEGPKLEQREQWKDDQAVIPGEIEVIDAPVKKQSTEGAQIDLQPEGNPTEPGFTRC